MNVHLYPSVLKNETRILKIACSLRKHTVFNEVNLVGRYAYGLPVYEDLGNNIHLYRLAPLFVGRFEGAIGKVLRTICWYLAVLWWIRSRSVDCLNCHSLPVLPLSVLIKWCKSCKLIYDIHELETETHATRGIRKRFAKWTERILIGRADAVCVVNRSIADWYEKSYGITRPCIVYNLPYRMTEALRPTGMLRRSIGLESTNAMLFIYQGLISPGRGIEMLIDVFAGIGGSKHLVCMGYGSLENLVLEAERAYANIHFIPAVAPDLIMKYTADADIGLSLIENTCLSYYLCAPNKLYEYAVSGLAAIVSDFPEMSGFVDTFDCGWKISPNVNTLRSLFESIDEETLNVKRQNAVRAGTQYCWENEEAELLRMYENLGLSRPRWAITLSK